MTRTGQIDAEAARIQENAQYTAQCNFCTAVVYERLHLGLGIPVALSSAAAGTAFILEASALLHRPSRSWRRSCQR